MPAQFGVFGLARSAGLPGEKGDESDASLSHYLGL